MSNKKKTFLFYLYLSLIALGLFIIQYNTVFNITIGGANAMLMLSLCVCFSMFAGEIQSVVFAVIIGSITDGAAAGTPFIFNTTIFILISVAVSLIVRFLFNNNYRSSITLGLIMSGIYYIAKFIICAPKTGLANSTRLFLGSYLPSIIYTTITVLILYFPIRQLFIKFKNS